MNFRSALASSLIILAFFIAMYGRRIIGEIAGISFQSEVALVMYGYAWWLVPVMVVTGGLFGFRNIIGELGLRYAFFKGLVFSVLTVLPMFAGAALLGNINTSLTVFDLLKKTLLAGFMEELLFRGFLFGLLFRKLKWGFIPASLPGAVIFGIAHIYQGTGFSETLGIFIVTTIGALWFAWLYIEWDENLWVPVLLHVFMNLSWTLFDVSNNALGDWRINISRMVTIALTVVITIIVSKRRKAFKINGRNLFLNR